jgi:16S rRNA (guanine527-N7)-methyltransferase
VLTDTGPLLAVLEESRRLGHIGPGALDAQIERSLALCAAFTTAPVGPIVDLGSGGGLPGLVMAAAWPDSSWLLVDGRALRARFLSWAVAELGWDGRIEVVGDQAERVGRGPWRARGEAAIARGFGPPAVTAECAAPLLRTGGTLVVTEPPGGRRDRWPAEGLAQLGLEPARSVVEPVAYQVLRQQQPCPDRYPRRVGVPAKRPLF